MPETYFLEQHDGSRIAYNILEPNNPEDIKKTPLVLIMGFVVSSYDPISLDLMAQDTVALVKHLKIKRFNLLGWSMGRIAVHVASNLPSDLEIEKLILCSSPVRPPEPSEFDSQRPPDIPKNIQEQKDKIMKKSEKTFTDYMVEHPDIFDKYAEIKFKAFEKHYPFEISKRQWEAIRDSNILSRSQTIMVPTLLIHGEADQVVSIKECKLLADEIPNNKFISIPKVGHM
ncbi:2554_t:CDS:2 [Dentiscutata erythropus]|uniref:2554_t:CDS:1 n=1 Tax=Dentiscutata erythropus TaxID=1348616 RepID=A0A9N9H9M5_9GLOM|nr:2554_t:CDS:2 [Dentiscutata erythropus]